MTVLAPCWLHTLAFESTMSPGELQPGDAIDLELLSLWVEGSKAAGNRLVERHFASVYRFFSTKVGLELDDVVQQTFLACLEAHKRYQRRSTFRTFLFGIARNQLYSHYREVKRARTLEFSVSTASDLSPSPASTIAAREHEQLFLQALQRLSLQSQIVVELAFWERMDANAIAEILDVPVNTAYSRLRRAKAQLRRHLMELAESSQVFCVSFEALDVWAAEIRDLIPEEHRKRACVHIRRAPLHGARASARRACRRSE